MSNPFSAWRPRSSSSNRWPSCALGRLAHHDRIGLGQGLKSCSEVRCLAHRGHRLGSADADEIPCDNQTGSDPDAHREPLGADRFNNRQAGADRAFGVRLVRVRPPEVRQHAIADEAGNVAMLGRHRRPNVRLVCCENFAQFFWIKPGRERSRAHDVGEQHRDLPSLGWGCRRPVVAD